MQGLCVSHGAIFENTEHYFESFIKKENTSNERQID